MVTMSRRLLLIVLTVVLLVVAGSILVYRGTHPCNGAAHCIVDK
jgi:hypothetical protein